MLWERGYLKRVTSNGFLEGAMPDLGARVLVEAIVQREEVDTCARLETEAVVHSTQCDIN